MSSKQFIGRKNYKLLITLWQGGEENWKTNGQKFQKVLAFETTIKL
jgi:hypothetical protein